MLAVFILLILGIRNTITATDIPQSPVKLQEATVTKEVNGNVVCVKFEDGKQAKVRFIGINTPEGTTKHDKYGAEVRNKMFNAILASEGYAEQMTVSPDVRYAGYFKTLLLLRSAIYQVLLLGNYPKT